VDAVVISGDVITSDKEFLRKPAARSAERQSASELARKAGRDQCRAC
jgi:hypothetical protein